MVVAVMVVADIVKPHLYNRFGSETRLLPAPISCSLTVSLLRVEWPGALFEFFYVSRSRKHDFLCFLKSHVRKKTENVIYVSF